MYSGSVSGGFNPGLAGMAAGSRGREQAREGKGLWRRTNPPGHPHGSPPPARPRLLTALPAVNYSGRIHSRAQRHHNPVTSQVPTSEHTRFGGHSRSHHSR